MLIHNSNCEMKGLLIVLINAIVVVYDSTTILSWHDNNDSVRKIQTFVSSLSTTSTFLSTTTKRRRHVFGTNNNPFNNILKNNVVSNNSYCYYSKNSNLQRQQSVVSQSSTMYMRDISASYWFTIGDQVQVVSNDVQTTTNGNFFGRIGTVVQTWEKCEVDPTCCCAEQVDVNMAIRVQFNRNTKHDNNNDCDETNKTDESNQVDDVGAFYYHYFSEDELVKYNNDSTNNHNDDTTTTGVDEQKLQQQQQQPFDGMSCTAFKLSQIPTSKPRGIANFEPKQVQQE